MLAAEAQRLSVALAKVEHVPLVTLDDRLRHFGRLADAAHRAPVDEVTNVRPPNLDSPLRKVLDPHPLEELFHHGDHALRVVGVADGLELFA